MSLVINKINDLLLLSPLSQTEIAQKLSISQATVSNNIVKNQAQYLKSGRARATRFYLRRYIDQENEWPVYRVTTTGAAELFATLYSVYPNGFVAALHRDQSWHCSESLPWWLDDMRPQGFIGRALAKAITLQGISSDPKDWSDNDVLRVLLRHPMDAIGNILIGSSAYETWLTAPVPAVITSADLLSIAEQTMEGWVGGSSAGGEQPKFAVQIEGHQSPCLVKFTAPVDEKNQPASRWADLLYAEHIALTTLADNHIPAAQSNIVDVERDGVRRVFLCVDRFDRVGPTGRQGLVSLRVLDAQFVGKRDNRWPVVAAQLADQGVICLDDVQTIKLMYCFGKLIANTDMHGGNASFIHNGSRPLSLAPAYDMLPMFYAPASSGEMKVSPPAIQLDSDIDGETWHQALQLSSIFWERIEACENIQAGFRRIAADMKELLHSSIAPVIARMA